MRNLSFLNKKYQLDIHSDADASVMMEIFNLREYLPAESVLKKASRGILDIGAHKGFFALYVRALNPEVPIYCYEPESENFSALKKHLELNKMNGIFVKNVGLMDREGMGILHVSQDSHNHSMVMDPGNMKTQKVNVTTLERILSKIGSVDLIKMDIEGAEFSILLHATDSVFSQCPAFFLEYHEYSPSMRAVDLELLFKKKGYSIQRFPSKYDRRMGFLWAKKS